MLQEKDIIDWVSETTRSDESPCEIIVYIEDGNKQMCGKCGKYGHNQRTCGKPKKQPKRVTTCKFCGICGHNIVTCHVKRNINNMNGGVPNDPV